MSSFTDELVKGLLVFLAVSSIAVGITTDQAFACKQIRGGFARYCDVNADRMLPGFGIPALGELTLVAWQRASHGQTDAVIADLGSKNRIYLVLLDKNCRALSIRRFDDLEQADRYTIAKSMKECSCDYPYGLGADGRKCGYAYDQEKKKK